MNSLLEHVSLLTRILGSPVAAVTLAASVPRDDAGDFDQKVLKTTCKSVHYAKSRNWRCPQLSSCATAKQRY